MSALIVLAVIAVIALVAVMWGVGIYNQLVTLKNRFQNAFSQIEVQLKRRYDLIPNLVETVKGYMQHEKGTLEAVIQARNQAVSGLERAAANPGDPAAMQALASAEAGTLRRARPAVRAVRGVSRSEGQPEHGPAQRGDHLDRKQSRLRPPGLQRRRDAVQHLPPDASRPIVFAGMLGHGQDAELLDFDDAQIAEAPKVSFT